MWSRQIQDAVCSPAHAFYYILIKLKTFGILFCGWLGGYTTEGSDAQPGRLLTIEEVGQIMNG